MLKLRLLFIITVSCHHLKAQIRDTTIIPFKIKFDTYLYKDADLSMTISKLKANEFIYGIGKHVNKYPVVLAEKNGQIGYVGEGVIDLNFDQRTTLYRADTAFTIPKSIKIDYLLTSFENVNPNSLHQDLDDDSTILMCRVKQNCKVTNKASIFEIPFTTIKPGEYVWAVGKGRENFVKVVKDSIIGYVSIHSLSLSQEEYASLNDENIVNKIKWAKSLTAELDEELQNERKETVKYVNQDSLFKAEMRAEKKLYEAAKVRIILIGLPYLGATAGVNLRVANFSRKTIKTAFISVKGIDTEEHVVGTEMAKMKGPIGPNKEMEEDFGSLFYLTEMDRYEITKVFIQYTDGTTWSVPKDLLSKVTILHKSHQEIKDKVKALIGY